MEVDEAKLKACFCKALGLRPDQITGDLKYQSIQTWDSIGHMHLVFELEDAFGIMFDTDDIVNMSDVAEGRKIVLRLLQEKEKTDEHRTETT